MTTTNHNEKKGFAGITDLATKAFSNDESNADAHDLPPKEIIPRAVHPIPQAATAGSHERQNEIVVKARTKKIQLDTWLIFIIFFGAIAIWLATHYNNQENNRLISPANLAADTSRGNTSLVNDNYHSSTEPAYNKPDAGTNLILSTSQIRWCLKETVRLDSIRNFINTDEITQKFNSLVKDFNSRCSSYRYVQKDFQIAQADVNNARLSITQEAMHDAQAWINLPNSGTDLQAEGAIHEAQRLLTQLGYKPGAIDGLYADKTIRAVEKFQKAHGLKADGLIDPSLLDLLRQETIKQKVKVSP